MDRKGFTLIELIIIIVLISIVAALAASRLGSISGSKAPTFGDKLLSDIRYAQNLAMTQNRRYRIYFNTAPSPLPDGYAVTTAAGLVVMDPAGSGPLSVTLNTGDYAGISVSTPAGGFIEFDSLGRPYDSSGSLIAGVITLVISPGGSTVTIAPRTGAVN
jgi:prepilin-type N-terminal cleavage/methylation domain-containing protein